MRLILKIFAVPLLLVLMFVCLLGNLATNFSGIVFTLFLFLLIICVIQSLWSQMMILVAMGFIAFVALVFIVWVLTTIEVWAEHLRNFIWS